MTDNERLYTALEALRVLRADLELLPSGADDKRAEVEANIKLVKSTIQQILDKGASDGN